LALAVIARFALPRVNPGGWSAAVDLPLALGLGAAVSYLAADWFARFHFEGMPIGGPDFSTYCQAVQAAIDRMESMNPQRATSVAAFVAPLARRFGLLDGLLIGATTAIGIGAVGSYLWGQAVAGRSAAIASALLVAAVGPLCLLTHTPSFYAEQIGAFLLASGLAAQALVKRSPGFVLVGAAASVALPLVDVRGILWLLVTLPLCLLGALTCRTRASSPGRWHRVALRAAVTAGVLAMLLLSWRAGRMAWPANLGGTLEGQTSSFAIDTWRRARGEDPANWSGQVHNCMDGRGFNWGWSDPTGLPASLLCVKSLMDDAAPLVPGATGPGYALHVEPWFPVLAGSTLVAVALLLCRPLRIVALAAPAVPAVLALFAAANEPEVRRIAPGLMIAPVVLGCAWALVADRLVGETTASQHRRGARLRWLLIGLRGVKLRWRWRRVDPRVGPVLGRLGRAAIVALLVFGVVPSWLSPTASWRARVALSIEWAGLAAGAPPKAPFDTACTDLLRREQDAGEPFAGDIGARWLEFQRH